MTQYVNLPPTPEATRLIQEAATQHRIQEATARTPLDDAETERDNAFGEMEKVFTYWNDLARALTNPALEHEDKLFDLAADLEAKVIELAYDVVRADQRMKQTEENPDFPFDSLDEGYFCPVCEFVSEDVIEAIGTPAQHLS